MCCSIDDKTTLIMPKGKDRQLPVWMKSSPAPKRLKPKHIVREIPDHMDVEFREESGRNNVVLTAYPWGIDRIHIYPGPPTPPNEGSATPPNDWPRSKEPGQLHLPHTPKKFFLDQSLIGPQPQEFKWHEDFVKKGIYPDPFEFEEWIQKTFGPAATKEWINQRYRLFQEDIYAVAKAHKEFDKGGMWTPEYPETPGTPNLLNCQALGILYGPEPKWYGTDRHYDSKWNQDKPYGPALADVTRYNLEEVRDELEKWLQNGAYRRAYKT
jgi:hypothetical protein